MNFKVGDIVRVRTLEEMANDPLSICEGGGIRMRYVDDPDGRSALNFASEMEVYCDQICTIKSINAEHLCYKLCGVESWFFNDAMLTSAIDEDFDDTELTKMLSEFCIQRGDA